MQQNPAQNLEYKLTIGTQEIKDIVNILNNPPFDENFTMVN